MKKIAVIVAALFVIFCQQSTSWAGLLGASYETCVAALGKPSRQEKSDFFEGAKAYSFTKNEWTIEIQFWKDEAHYINYSKGYTQMTESEKNALLNGYSEGQSWTAPPKETLVWAYERSDHKVYASKDFLTIGFITSEFNAAWNESDGKTSKPQLQSQPISCDSFTANSTGYEWRRASLEYRKEYCERMSKANQKLKPGITGGTIFDSLQAFYRTSDSGLLKTRIVEIVALTVTVYQN